jgi:hypothetical protein
MFLPRRVAEFAVRVFGDTLAIRDWSAGSFGATGRKAPKPAISLVLIQRWLLSGSFRNPNRPERHSQQQKCRCPESTTVSVHIPYLMQLKVPN